MKITSEIEGEPLTQIRQMEIIEELEVETHAFANISTELVQKAGQYTQKMEVPVHYQEYVRIFSEEALQRFPPLRPWHHAIELKEGAPAVINCKVYL
jgi:hypothetical protein